ncbi:MAG: hypothetical protein M1457_06165, partial [bacterium]|nr:hypothetical protein [bacterium]
MTPRQQRAGAVIAVGCLLTTLALAAPPGSPIVLQPLYRVHLSGGGFTSATDAKTTGTVVSQTGYLAKNSVAGTTPLHRYRNERNGAWRDGHSLSAPWKRVETLGYTFDEAENRVPLKSYRDAGGGYLTLNANEAVPPDCEPVETLGYCYERYGMDQTRLMNVRKGAVEIRFDRVSGGAIWHIVHRGTQLVNNYYYGRQGCVALDFWLANDPTRYIPCDCGLTALLPEWLRNPSYRMGAPCPVFAREGGDAVFIRTIPIESSPTTNRHLGGGGLNPTVYSAWAIEKRARLGIRGHAGVLQYK